MIFQYRNNCRVILGILILSSVVMIGRAQNVELKIPIEMQKFINRNETVLAFETADLNGDGTQDFIIVKEDKAPDRDGEGQRSLLIILRGADGRLTLAGRNQKVVYCRSCGGAAGDPFAGVSVGHGYFTVSNYGGSNLRWSDDYQFKYFPQAHTWRLVQITIETFNALEPQKVKTRVIKPKKIWKVNIDEYDPAALRR